jgi:WXXGXW repeat (2 copies)
MVLRVASRFHIFTGLSVALLLAGCHGNQSATSATDQSQDQAAQQASSDPASANVIPVSNTSSSESESDNGAAAPSSPDYASQAPYDDSADESDYGIQPEETAADPPPPLPDYDQPSCPGDGYIWTPGYWDYASAGYYWVPGAWVQAPYTGALWTPGYWGYSHSRYAFFHGYWGPHIGFYGGINYGFGYVGYGYQGGYWNGNVFDLNRTVNNVNVTVVRNVYVYKITNVTVNRVSFNGGTGGIQVRPRPAELDALREPHAPPMATQIAIRQSASVNRAQFYSANHGRPAEFIAPHPVAAVPNVRPVVTSGLRHLPPPPRAVAEAHPGPAPVNRPEPVSPNRPEAEPNRPEPNRPEPAQPEASHPEPSHAEPGHPAPPPVHTEPNRPAPPPARTEPNHPATPVRNEAAPSHPAPAHTEPARRAAPPAQHAAPSHPQPEHKPTPEEQKKAPEEHPQP